MAPTATITPLRNTKASVDRFSTSVGEDDEDVEVVGDDEELQMNVLVDVSREGQNNLLQNNDGPILKIF